MKPMKGCDFDEVQRAELMKHASDACNRPEWKRVRWEIVLENDDTRLRIASFIDGQHLPKVVTRG